MTKVYDHTMSEDELANAFADAFSKAKVTSFSKIGDYQSWLKAYETFLAEGSEFFENYDGVISDEELRRFDVDAAFSALSSAIANGLQNNAFPSFELVRSILEDFFGRGSIFISLIKNLLTELNGDLEIGKRLAGGKAKPDKETLQKYLNQKKVSSEANRAKQPLVVEAGLVRLITSALKDDESAEDWVRLAIMEKLLRDGVVASIFDQGRGSSSDQIRLRHIRRARGALPDPSQPASAEINRRGKQISLRIGPSLLQKIDSSVGDKEGSDRTGWMKDSINSFLAREHELPDFEVAGEPVSEMVMMRFEPQFIELVDKAAKEARTTRADWLRRVAVWSLSQEDASLPALPQLP